LSKAGAHSVFAGSIENAPAQEDGRGVLLVRPAWAHYCGCKSYRKLITANEVKRNCMRVTECGKEAWIEAASPTPRRKSPWGMDESRTEDVGK